MTDLVSRNRLVADAVGAIARKIASVKLLPGADAGELPSTQELEQLVLLVEQRNSLILEQEKILARSKELTAQVLSLEAQTIPSLLANAPNLDKIIFADGSELQLKDELFASITEANRDPAFAWLEGHGHGDVIKDSLTLNLGRGEIAQLRAQALIVAAEQNGVDDYTRKRAVHPGTLQALLKEQLAEGVEVPKETFGVFQQRRAIIKLAKK